MAENQLDAGSTQKSNLLQQSQDHSPQNVQPVISFIFLFKSIVNNIFKLEICFSHTHSIICTKIVQINGKVIWRPWKELNINPI